MKRAVKKFFFTRPVTKYIVCSLSRACKHVPELLIGDQHSVLTLDSFYPHIRGLSQDFEKSDEKLESFFRTVP